MPARLVVLVLPALLLVTACGGRADGVGKTGESRVTTQSTTATPASRPPTYSEVYVLRLGTPRARVIRQIGPPDRPDKVRPFGVVARCFRYLAWDETTAQISSQYEFRLCYDRRDRLSLKSTAPPS
jgi:hypothetical protein